MNKEETGQAIKCTQFTLRTVSNEGMRSKTVVKFNIDKDIVCITRMSFSAQNEVYGMVKLRELKGANLFVSAIHLVPKTLEGVVNGILTYQYSKDNPTTPPTSIHQ